MSRREKARQQVIVEKDVEQAIVDLKVVQIVAKIKEELVKQDLGYERAFESKEGDNKYLSQDSIKNKLDSLEINQIQQADILREIQELQTSLKQDIVGLEQATQSIVTIQEGDMCARIIADGRSSPDCE